MPDPGAQSPTTFQQNHGNDTDMKDVVQTQSGREWASGSGDFSISTSLKSIDSTENDKVEVLSKQMAVTFFSVLATMEYHSHKGTDCKVSFGSFAISSFTDTVSVSIP